MTSRETKKMSRRPSLCEKISRTIRLVQIGSFLCTCSGHASVETRKASRGRRPAPPRRNNIYYEESGTQPVMLPRPTLPDTNSPIAQRSASMPPTRQTFDEATLKQGRHDSPHLSLSDRPLHEAFLRRSQKSTPRATKTEPLSAEIGYGDQLPTIPPEIHAFLYFSSSIR